MTLLLVYQSRRIGKRFPLSTYRPAVLECCSDLSCAVVPFPIWRSRPEGIQLVATISSACLQQKFSFLFDLS